MPYGLKNAPAVFRDLHGQGMVVCIDDILIYSATRAAHVSLVRKVLRRLLEHDLYVKAEMCVLQTSRFLPGLSHFHLWGGDGV
jgi:hypothetical protein